MYPITPQRLVIDKLEERIFILERTLGSYRRICEDFALLRAALEQEIHDFEIEEEERADGRAKRRS